MKIRLVVLGLLMRGPRHGYELVQALEQPPFSPWADVYAGSVYHALKVLEREQKVQLQETSQRGHKLRATYAVTPAGRAEFHDLLEQAWKEQPRSFPTNLYASLTFLEHLPREALLEACERLITQVEKTQADWLESEAH